MKRPIIFTISAAFIMGTMAMAQTAPAPPNSNTRPGTISGFTPGAVSGFTPNAVSGFTPAPVQGFTRNPVQGLSNPLFAPTRIAPLTSPLAGVGTNRAQILSPLPPVIVPSVPGPSVRTNFRGFTNRVPMTPLF